MTNEPAGKRRRLPRRGARLSALRLSGWYELWPWAGLLAGLAGGLLLLIAGSPRSGPLYKIRVGSFDFLLLRREPRPLDGPGSPVAVVGIDEASLGKFGDPFPRGRLQEAIQTILDAGPAGVVLDMQFTTPDRTANLVREALDAAEKDVRRPGAFDALSQKYDETSRLLTTLSDPRVIGTLYPYGHDTTRVVPQPIPEDVAPKLELVENLLLTEEDCLHFPGAEGVTLDREEFLEAMVNHGSARLEAENDGIMRRYPLFIRYGESLYPSLAVAAATLRTEMQSASVDCEPSGILEIFAIGGDYPLGLGGESGYPDGRIWINFGGKFRDSFPDWTSVQDLIPIAVSSTASAATVQTQNAERTERWKMKFAGKLVFLGPRTDYDDKYPTYNDGAFPGVAIHATVAHGLITKQSLRRSAFTGLFTEPFLCVLIGLLVSILFLKIESTWLLALAPASPTLGFAASWILLGRGYLVDTMLPGLVGFVAVMVCGALRFIVEQRRAEQERLRAEQEGLRAENEKIRAERLGAFLSPEVAKIAGENPELLKPQRQEISILFSDIRSFTTVAEGMPPETLAEMLSEYLTWMTEIVLSNHGTLDKYIGDAVMAIFGAPLPQKAHAKWACTTALEMIDALDGLNERWREQGRTTLQFGIGINTGWVVVGTMGSKNKPEYTCIGDDVNFASRAEGLTKAYGATIVVGESTRMQAGDDFLFRDLGPVKVKGKTRGVKIFELLGTRSQITDTAWVDVFHQGLNAFLLRDWAKAEELFERVKTMRGGSDGPSKAFLTWTAAFKAHPPDDAWDGTLDRAEK